MDTPYDKTLASSDTEDLPGLSRFGAHVGEMFDVLVPKGPWRLELVEVNALPAQADGAGEDAFSLVFKAQIDCTIRQGSVALEHEKLGWTVLYLISAGEDEESRYFEAVFN